MNLLQVSALLLATPTIDGAKAELSDGQLTIEVTTSEPMARDEIRTKVDGKVLSIYAEGAKLGGKRTFGEGQLAITATKANDLPPVLAVLLVTAVAVALSRMNPRTKSPAAIVPSIEITVEFQRGKSETWVSSAQTMAGSA